MLHPALSSDAILHPALPSCPSAASTTEKSAVAVHLNPTSYDPAAAVLADGREGVYGALQAVEYVRFTGRDNLESHSRGHSHTPRIEPFVSPLSTGYPFLRTLRALAAKRRLKRAFGYDAACR